MATAIVSEGRAFRPQWSLFVGGAFAPNQRPDGNSGHWEGGVLYPKPLPLDPAVVAAEAAPTGIDFFSVGGALAPNLFPNSALAHLQR
ncbi:hypothetical protein, partial [Thermoflexus hugenholtzii]